MDDATESADVIAAIFNKFTDEQKESMPDEYKKKIGRIMYVNGYSLVFGRWYKQSPSLLTDV